MFGHKVSEYRVLDMIIMLNKKSEGHESYYILLRVKKKILYQISWHHIQ